MNVRTSPRPRREHGYFLLESLIAVLIVALGVLGLIGLLAKSTQSIDESKYRGEASYLANAYVGQMWVADKATLAAHFSDSGGGAEYDEFKALVQQRLPSASAPVEAVADGPTTTSSIVNVTLAWQMPNGESHQFSLGAIVGANK
jgi:type IV pilus assembly protein PilV